VRIPDGNVERVASLSDIRRWNVEWSGLTTDDSPLILRDAGPEEIYAMDVD